MTATQGLDDCPMCTETPLQPVPAAADQPRRRCTGYPGCRRLAKGAPSVRVLSADAPALGGRWPS